MYLNLDLKKFEASPELAMKIANHLIASFELEHLAMMVVSGDP